ncbi:MAG: hypothetical protein ABL930_04030 [Pseudobdellovibrio sp.]
MFKLFLLLLLSSINLFAQEGFKNAKWGEKSASVMKKLGKSGYSCLLGATALTHTAKFNQNFKGLTLSSNNLCKNPGAYSKPESYMNDCLINTNLKLKDTKDGCALFFEDRFIAFWQSLSPEKVDLAEAELILVKKYGESEIVTKKHQTTTVNVDSWDLEKTTIYKARDMGDLQLFYFSKEENDKIAAAYEKEYAKLKNKAEKELDKKKKETANNF